VTALPRRPIAHFPGIFDHASTRGWTAQIQGMRSTAQPACRSIPARRSTAGAAPAIPDCREHGAPLEIKCGAFVSATLMFVYRSAATKHFDPKEFPQHRIQMRRFVLTLRVTTNIVQSAGPKHDSSRHEMVSC
jgi:hypothetical protein